MTQIKNKIYSTATKIKNKLGNFFKNCTKISFPITTNKKLIRTGAKLVLVLGVIFFLFFSKNWIQGVVNSNTSANQGQEEVYSETVAVNKEFVFPGLDNNGEAAGEVLFLITDLEKTDQVIVQEKTYTAKNNKLFLIVNLELTNDSTKELNIYPGDLIRLELGNEDKKYAPDLHNNYVLVAPLSTKNDRLGFVVDKKVEQIKLLVGELDKDKETVNISFPGKE